MAEYAYLKKNRLSEVIRLIAILAKDQKYSFRTETGLQKALNGAPKSAGVWFELASEHPEFFKFNQGMSTVVLLMRFLNQPEADEESYEPLNIDQTQKLIDQAIALHDKQIARYQRNNFMIPLWSSTIAAIVTIVVAILTFSSNASLKDKLQRLNEKLDKIELEETKKPADAN